MFAVVLKIVERDGHQWIAGVIRAFKLVPSVRSSAAAVLSFVVFMNGHSSPPMHSFDPMPCFAIHSKLYTVPCHVIHPSID